MGDAGDAAAVEAGGSSWLLLPFTATASLVSSLPTWALVVLCATVVYFLVWFFKPLMTSMRITVDHPDELYFETPDKGPGTSELFPRLQEKASVALSLIVPAYNEEDRLPDMMGEMIAYLRERRVPSWEIIIVDDGSHDRTGDVALEYSEKWGSDRVRLLRLRQNCGKGGAVRKGMLRARGEYLLMVDADGATEAAELRKLMEELSKIEHDGLGVAVGSRAHIVDTDAVAHRSALRNLLMHGFHAFVAVLAGGHGVRDTQCGFKLFTREAAARLFPAIHIERWAFDVELLYLTVLLKIPVVEVAVNWREIPGSKLDVISATFQMARDILLIRLCYLLRVWRPMVTPADERANVLFRKKPL